MYTSMMLCNCYMLDSNYNHTVDFKNKESQLAWFYSKAVYTLNESMYQRKNELEIRVDKSISDLNFCNYLITRNDDGKDYFYFIMDKEYVNDYTTTLYLKLDVIQTYLFLLLNYNFKSCLVDRQHIKRWDTDSNGNITPSRYYSMEDEGLELGEYQIGLIHNVYDYTNKGSYIITSSEMLGISNETRGSSANGGGGGDTPSYDYTYLDGYMDKNGLRMVKSFEGFSSLPYNIGDGTDTIGYGCTSEHSTDAYNSLLPSCTEEQASIVLGEYAFSSYSLPIKEQLDQNKYNWNNMTQDLFNAMVSFAWNSGAYAMQYNYPTLWNMIIEGYNITNPSALAEQWAITNIMEGTEYEEGLRIRRTREGQIAIGIFDYTEFLIANVQDGGYITDNNGYGYIPSEYQ